MSIAWALLIIRGVAGLTLAAHGAQKLFGWFGGPGYAKLESGFDKMGYKPAWVWASLAILGELGGGLSLAFGFLTPLGAAGALGAMVMAGATHWEHGFFASKGGFEYPLALLAMSAGIGLAGPGTYALDTLFRLTLHQVPLFIALAIAALLVDAVGITLKRSAAATDLAAKAHTA